MRTLISFANILWHLCQMCMSYHIFTLRLRKRGEVRHNISFFVESDDKSFKRFTRIQKQLYKRDRVAHSSPAVPS